MQYLNTRNTFNEKINGDIMKTCKKGLIIISLLLILMMGLGAVSASENITDDSIVQSAGSDDIQTASNEDNEIQTESQINLTGGTFDDIQKAIDECEEGGTVELTGNYTSTGNQINIEKSITINGAKNTLLDAGKKSSIFRFNAMNKTIVLNGLTLINSKNPTIFEEDGKMGVYSIMNCHFENNPSCIDIIRGNSTCFVANCIFTNNDGVTYDTETETFRNLSMINCNFTNNRGYVADFGSWKGYAKYCNFINNTNGIGNVDSLIDCRFENNNLGKSLIKNANSIINSTFKNNKFTTAHMSINLIDYANLISNSTFIGNTAKIVKTDSNANRLINSVNTVINCEFKNNKFSTGGAIHGVRTVINSTFTNNYAIVGGAIYEGLWNETIQFYELTLDSCDFISNTAEGSGAAVYCDYGNHNITKCNFISNKVINGMGALYISTGTTTVVSCNFTNNYANTYGSAICVDYTREIWQDIPSKLTINNSKFTNNIAKGTYSKYVGYDIINYGNGTVGELGKQLKISFINCTPFIKNDNMFKLETKIIAPKVSMTYKQGKYLTATLKTLYNTPYKNLKVKIALNGKVYERTTDKNGQVKLLINLAPNTYKATIVYSGNNYLKKSSQTTTITVKKLTAKLTAPAKTLSSKLQTKKYSIILQDNNKKAMKNAPVYLKVNGKTYAAKTLSNGVATFKITNLANKGTYKATVTYAGGKYFKKISTQAQIIVK